MAKIQFRRDTSSNWTSFNPILADGEIGIDKTLNRFKIGNGLDSWMTLAYASGTVSNLFASEVGVDISNFAGGSGLLNDTTDTVQKALEAITIGLDLADETYDGLFSAIDKNKLRIMSQIMGVKDFVKVATTTNIPLIGTPIIDTFQTSIGDRILVKNQTNTTENGIYVASSTSWVRSSDTDTAQEVSSGIIVSVLNGTQAGTSWIFQNNILITLGTSPITFTQYTTYNSATDEVDGGTW